MGSCLYEYVYAGLLSLLTQTKITSWFLHHVAINHHHSLLQRAVKLANWLCVGVPDYLKDQHTNRGKMAILEKRQLELRKSYMASTAENGLGPDMYNIKFGLRDIGNKAANLVTLAEGESLENEPFMNNHKSNKGRCHCEVETDMHKLSLSVAKILELMEDNILKDQRRAEWRMLGALIDRILLIVLITAATSTTLYIYVIAPVVNQIQKTDIE